VILVFSDEDGFVFISRQCEIYRVAQIDSPNHHPTKSLLATPRRKALAVALLVLVALMGVWWGAHVRYRNMLLTELRADVLAELDPYGNALTIDLRRRFDLIYGLRGWAITNSSPTQFGANFETFARELGQGIGDIRNMCVAPAGVVRFVYPRAGNEAILGRDLVNDPRAEVRADVSRAIELGKIVISGPYELLVGGYGATARLAIFHGGNFWGIINVTLDLLPIFAEAGITAQNNLQLALRVGRGRVLFGAPAVFDSQPVIHRVALPDGHWELAAIPNDGWSGAIRRDLAIFDSGALASALLLSAIAYLLSFRDARLALRVGEGTRALTSELQHRTTVETELRAARSRYQTLVEVNPDGMLVNFHKKIVYANDAAARLLGAASPEDLLGRSPFEFVEPERRAEVEQRYERARASGQPNPPSIQRRVRLDGSFVYAETVAAPLAWDDGSAVQVIMRDVTEQRRAEAWVRSLIETTQDAVVSIDRQARIVLFNPAAQRIFGYRPEEVVGQKVNMLMPEPYTSEHDGYIERYERTGEAHAIGRIRMVTAKRKNGETFPIELSVAKITGDQEVQYGAFIRDISDKVKLQQQAVESERLATIGTMAAKFGHELGNPLNGMSLTVQLLEQRLRKQSPTLDEQATSTLARLKTEISRLNSLLQDFRSLSRKESYNFKPAQLAELVAEAIEIELPYCNERDVKVVAQFAPDLPNVRVDSDKIKQVILNLAKNAVEAMPNGGKLLFSGSAGTAAVSLEVADSGAGIPAEVDVFEPFFTTKSFGTGVGMTIVRQILAAHGGSISYQSEVGKGTTFTVRLPLA
jgi:two-component system sensor kinase FixL